MAFLYLPLVVSDETEIKYKSARTNIFISIRVEQFIRNKSCKIIQVECELGIQNITNLFIKLSALLFH